MTEKVGNVSFTHFMRILRAAVCKEPNCLPIEIMKGEELRNSWRAYLARISADVISPPREETGALYLILSGGVDYTIRLQPPKSHRIQNPMPGGSTATQASGSSSAGSNMSSNMYPGGQASTSTWTTTPEEITSPPSTEPQGGEVLRYVECDICLVNLLNPATVGDEDTEEVDPSEFCTTVCGHMYHKFCLAKWFKGSASCPTCRTGTSQLIPLFPSIGEEEPKPQDRGLQQGSFQTAEANVTRQHSGFDDGLSTMHKTLTEDYYRLEVIHEVQAAEFASLLETHNRQTRELAALKRIYSLS